MLDDRKSAILRAVVQTYIETAQPVGSTHVVDRANVGVSPATIRNDMNHLEREGYLVQPHTSAGRIPTEKGYRFFVDHLDAAALDPSRAKTVRSVFAAARGELDEMLRSTSRLLTKLTASAAVVVGEVAAKETIKSVQVVSLAPRTVLVVLVTSSTAVLKRSVDLPEVADDVRCAEIERQLRARLADVEVVGISAHRSAVIEAIAVEHQAVAGAVFDSIAQEFASMHPHVFVEGTPHLAGAFDAVETVRSVLDLLEHHLVVVELINDVMNRGLSVAIGSETGVTPLADCSIVVAPFAVGGERAGTIGVLGPTRMNYRDAVAAVAVVSERLSRVLTEGTYE